MWNHSGTASFLKCSWASANELDMLFSSVFWQIFEGKVGNRSLATLFVSHKQTVPYRFIWRTRCAVLRMRTSAMMILVTISKCRLKTTAAQEKGSAFSLGNLVKLQPLTLMSIRYGQYLQLLPADMITGTWPVQTSKVPRFEMQRCKVKLRYQGVSLGIQPRHIIAWNNILIQYICIPLVFAKSQSIQVIWFQCDVSICSWFRRGKEAEAQKDMLVFLHWKLGLESAYHYVLLIILLGMWQFTCPRG